MRWLAALALVTACAGPETRHVVIRDLAFQPGDLPVSVGDTVAWRNDDIVPHTVTFEAREGRDEVQSGETVQVVVPPGDTLAYFCRYHPSMTGRLIVR
jgi:plastocyanin